MQIEMQKVFSMQIEMQIDGMSLWEGGGLHHWHVLVRRWRLVDGMSL